MGAFVSCLDRRSGDCIGRPGDSENDVDLMNHKLHTDADGILNSYLDQNGHGKDAVQFQPPEEIDEESFGKPMKQFTDKDEDVPVQYKNKYELEVKLSISGMLDLLESLRTETPLNKFDLKLNEPKIVVQLKMKGSDLTKEFPLFRVEYIFEASCAIRNIVKAIHNPDERIKWDKDIEVAHGDEVVNEKILIWYQRNKSQIRLISQRDFAEKKLFFKKDNIEYIYFTSYPDELKPPEPKIVRAQTILGFHVIEMLEDGRIKFEGLMQSDFNLGTGMMARAASATALSQIPKSLKVWFSTLEDHVIKMPPIEDKQ